MSLTAQPIESVKIFYSYAHEDEALRDELEKHLSNLERQGHIVLWHDRKIDAGKEWAHEIAANIQEAQIILLLISPDFMASQFCNESEVPLAMERHETEGVRVIPVILRPVDWQDTLFHKLQALPTNSKPITKWPDRDEAFLDVAKGIRKVVEELASKLSLAPAPPGGIQKKFSPASQVWNVPYRRNPFFTGRETLLKELHDRLTSTKAAALTQAISGLGGIGKTQTALEYAYRYREEYRFVLWVSAASRDSLISDFVKVATLLKLPEKDEQDQNMVVLAVKRWLTEHGDWLLVLDNADDLEMVAEFLPMENQGHIILTTRAQYTGKVARSLELEKMDLEEGILLLLRCANMLRPDAPLAQASREDRANAEAIVREMDGLPLALDQAGAYIEATGCGLSGYFKLYKRHRAELLKRKDRLSSEYPYTVATTWALSFQQVEQANPAAAELLRLCAFLAPDAIAEEIITEGASHLGPVLSPVAADPLALNDTVEVLRRYSLVRRNPTTKILTIHRLVQVVLKDGMDNKTQRHWAKRAVRAVNEVFPDSEKVETWQQCERYLLHAFACATFIEQWSFVFPQARRLLNNVGSYLEKQARYDEALPLLQQALAIDEKMLGTDDASMATSLNNLAELYTKQGKYIQAAHLHQQALMIRQKALRPDDASMATSLNNLAVLYTKQGKYIQAAHLHQQALMIRQNVLGTDHPDTTSSLNNLATLFMKQGEYDDAEPLLKQALTIFEKVLGPDHPDTATSLSNLGGLYQSQEKYDQAEPLYQLALAIHMKLFGSDGLAVAADLYSLAELYYHQEKYDQAESLLKQTLTIFEKVRGADHSETMTCLDNLAVLYEKQGKYDQVESIYQRSLRIREKVLGLDHPELATNLNNLASLYHRQGKYDQAVLLYQRAPAIDIKVFGPDHLEVVTQLNNLAAVYTDQGKYDDAELLWQRALAVCEKVLGVDHPNTVIVRENYTSLRQMNQRGKRQG